MPLLIIVGGYSSTPDKHLASTTILHRRSQPDTDRQNCKSSRECGRLSDYCASKSDKRLCIRETSKKRQYGDAAKHT